MSDIIGQRIKKAELIKKFDELNIKVTEQLDYTLYFIRDNCTFEYSMTRIYFLENFNNKISTHEQDMLLDKLSRDGYIKYSNIDIIITFEGLFFCEKGGYANSFGMAKRRKKIQNLKDWFLIVGTWVAGIAAVLLFLTELYKLLHESK